MSRGDVPLQYRAGANNEQRPAPFGVYNSKLDSRVRKVTGTPFTLIERKEGEDPVCLALSLPLTFGYLINRTGGPITVDIFAVDAQGRRMLSDSGLAIPNGVSIPLITSFLGVISLWLLAPGERMEAVITAGDPNAGQGLWWWQQKQIVSGRVETNRIVLPPSDTVVTEPLPGRTLYPSSFPFDDTFRCLFLFNYSPTTATTANVTLEAEEGDVRLETALPVPANSVTPLLAAFGLGHAFSYPNKLRVELASVPADGDIVFESSCLLIDEPKEL